MLVSTHPTARRETIENREAEQRRAPRPDIPTAIVETTPRRHITGLLALNTPARYRMGGDWHMHGNWFSTKPSTINEFDLTNDHVYGKLLDRLGRIGLADARPGLAQLNHPGANSPTRIWVATHPRAVVETAWAEIRALTQPELASHPAPPFDGHELTRMMPYPDQWIALHWYAWRLRSVMNHDEKNAWDEWRHDWRPQ